MLVGQGCPKTAKGTFYPNSLWLWVARQQKMFFVIWTVRNLAAGFQHIFDSFFFFFFRSPFLCRSWELSTMQTFFSGLTFESFAKWSRINLAWPKHACLPWCHCTHVHYSNNQVRGLNCSYKPFFLIPYVAPIKVVSLNDLSQAVEETIHICVVKMCSPCKTGGLCTSHWRSQFVKTANIHFLSHLPLTMQQPKP